MGLKTQYQQQVFQAGHTLPTMSIEELADMEVEDALAREAQQKQMEAMREAEDSDDYILSIAYLATETKQTNVKIVLRDITSFLAADSVVDLADICMKIANAITSLLEALKVDPKAVVARRTSIGSTWQSSPSSKGPKSSKRLSIKVTDAGDFSVKLIFPYLFVSVANCEHCLFKPVVTHDAITVLLLFFHLSTFFLSLLWVLTNSLLFLSIFYVD